MAKITQLEFQRKIFHIILVTMFAIFFCLRAFDLPTLFVLLGFTIAISFSYMLTSNQKRPLFHSMFHLFERKQNRDFPGKNVVSLLLAGIIVYLLFPKDAVVAGFLILAWGDSLAYLVGVKYGKIPVPWNKEKHVEGRIAGIVAATAAVAFIYPFSIALNVTTVAMLIETLPLEKYHLDDNFVIPLVSAFLFSVL